MIIPGRYINLNRSRLESIEFSSNVKQEWVSTCCVMYTFRNGDYIFLNFDDHEEQKYFEKINSKSAASQ